MPRMTRGDPNESRNAHGNASIRGDESRLARSERKPQRAEIFKRIECNRGVHAAPHLRSADRGSSPMSLFLPLAFPMRAAVRMPTTFAVPR